MRFSFILTAMVLALQPHRLAASAFTIDDWDLTVSVFGTGDVSNEVDGTTFNTVTNPFSDSHSSRIGGSSSSANYDFHFAQTGEFQIETNHVAGVHDFRSLRSTTSGDVFVTPIRNVTLQYSVLYDYLLPSDSMTARASIGVANAQTGEVLLNENRLHNTVLGLGPGSFSIQGEVSLTAGSTWRVNYFSRILVDESSAGGVGTGTGVFEFQITPEPHAALLLLFGTAAAVRRRPRRAMAFILRAPSKATP